MAAGDGNYVNKMFVSCILTMLQHMRAYLYIFFSR